MEAVKSIYDNPDDEAKLEDIPRPVKNKKKRGKKLR